MTNFGHLPRTKDYMKHLTGACYDVEKNLYGRWINEAFNHFGVKCQYYITDYNTDYDVIFGEDMDRHVVRRFPVQVYFVLPPEDDMASRFGIEELDNIEMFISKLQFQVASTLDYDDQYGATSGTFAQYIPKLGDLIRSTSNYKFYEILDVGEEDNQFLQTSNTWTLKVRLYRDNHVGFSTSADGVLAKTASDELCASPFTSAIASYSLSAYADQEDMFDVTDLVNRDKGDVVHYSDSATTSGSYVHTDPTTLIVTSGSVKLVADTNDPFAGW